MPCLTPNEKNNKMEKKWYWIRFNCHVCFPYQHIEECHTSSRFFFTVGWSITLFTEQIRLQQKNLQFMRKKTLQTSEPWVLYFFFLKLIAEWKTIVYIYVDCFLPVLSNINALKVQFFLLGYQLQRFHFLGYGMDVKSALSHSCFTNLSSG